MVLNDTTSYSDSSLSQNYTQGDTRPDCMKIPLQVLLDDGTYNNTFVVNASMSRNITLIHNHNECFPGRYYTAKFTIRNTTQTNESVNLTVFIDIPISNLNTLNNQTGIGNFSGQMPVNATTYHSFYFNATFTNSTSENMIINATGFTINLTSSGDVDVFLVDSSGVLRAKSINKTHNNESLIYNSLPLTSEMWEIRIFGNSTSAITYNGRIIFTTLNSTNASLNFGTMNSTTNATITYTLRNEGNLSINNLREGKDVYYIYRFSGNNANGNTNYSFLVPASSMISKIKASLNWTGGSNYTLNLYDSTNSLARTSVNSYRFANVSGVNQEEYNDTTDLLSNSGYWRVMVVNNTNITDSYNVTVYLYLNSSAWTTTNFTSMSLSTTGNNNYTTDVQMNFTVPSLSLNGTYGGNVRYLDANGAGINIPINFEVSSGMLLVNDTFSTDTNFEIFTLNESYGFNRTKIIYFNISNPGFYDLTLNFTNSTNLTCHTGSCSGYYANFTFNTTTSLSKNSFKLIEVQITYNSSLPTNTVYAGWIYINSTNDNSNLTSHPYSGVYVNLRLNITNYANVKILGISKSYNSVNNVVNTTNAENITIALDVQATNGTKYTDLLITNFTGVWLQERNTSTRVPTTGNLSFYATYPSSFYCTSGCPTFGGVNHYYLNATIPINTTGGIYNVYVNATDIGPYDSAGIGMNSSSPIVVNNSGLYMSSINGTSISIANASSYLLAINVTNYGPIAPSVLGTTATISRTESCSGYDVSTFQYANCPSTSFDPAGYNSSCVAYVTITTVNSNYSACALYITGTPSYMWYNPNGVNVSVEVTKASDSTTGTTGQTAADTTVANLAFTSAPTLVTVQQNSSNTTTVQVKNTGTKIQSVLFTILDLSSSWWSANATATKILDINKVVGYLVTFNVGNAEVKDYKIAFKAYSSEKSVTSNFTLRVTPTPAKQLEINNTFYVYLTNFTKLGEEINKSKAEGFNVTNSTEKYNLAKTKIDSAQSYINNKDYFNANNILPDIKTLLDDAWVTLAKDIIAGKVVGVGSSGLILSGKYLTYILIGGGIAGGVVLAYLFWPTKESAKTASKYKPEKKEKIELALSEPEKNKIEGVFSKLKEKFAHSKKEETEYKGS
jgi:hypothetical protein